MKNISLILIMLAFTNFAEAKSYWASYQYGNELDCIAPGYCNNGQAQCAAIKNVLNELSDIEIMPINAKCYRGRFLGPNDNYYGSELFYKFFSGGKIGKHILSARGMSKEICLEVRNILRPFKNKSIEYRTECLMFDSDNEIHLTVINH